MDYKILKDGYTQGPDDLEPMRYLVISINGNVAVFKATDENETERITNADPT